MTSSASYEYGFDPEDVNSTAAAVYHAAGGGGHRVLDLGSGPGIVGSALASSGKIVTCLDVREDLLQVAASRGVQETIVADLEDEHWTAALDGREYDTIILADVLEHLRHPESVLEAIRRDGLLTPTGRLVISYPNAGHIYLLAALATGELYMTETGLLDRTHLRWFTRSSMTAMCESVGYRTLSTVRIHRTLEQSPGKLLAASISADTRRTLELANEDSRTYQFVEVYVPGPVTTVHADLGAWDRIRSDLLDARSTERRLAAELTGVTDQVNSLHRDLAVAQTKLDRERSAKHLIEHQLAATQADLSKAQTQLQAITLELDAAITRAESLAVEAEDLRKLQYARAKAAKERLESAFAERDQLAAGLKKAEAELARSNKKLEQVYASQTWRLGSAIKAPFLWLIQSLKWARRKARADRSGGGASRGTEPVGDSNNPPVLALVPEESLTIRQVYEEAVQKDRFSSTSHRIAFGVYTLDFDQGRGDLFVAVGIGRELKALGYEVMYVPRQLWYDIPQDTETFVAMLPMVEPGRLPAETKKIAWVRNETVRWVAKPDLNVFDGIIVSSHRSLETLNRVYAGQTGIIPLGVDLELFHGEVSARRHGVVSTVNQWGRERDVNRALRFQKIEFPLAIYGMQRGLAEDLAPFAHGLVSFFALPSLYRQVEVVLDDMNHTTVSFGNVNSRLLESLAAGSLPITNAASGLPELGLEEVPVFRDDAELHALVERFRLNPELRRSKAKRLQAVVRERHGYANRAKEVASFIKSLGDTKRRPLLGFFPDYRSTNPFQHMLYREIADVAAVLPVSDPFEIPEAEGPGDAQGFVFHLHWTAPILNPSADATEAFLRTERFLERIDQIKDKGGRFIWTIHNEMPHECPYPDEEVRLRRGLAARADIVHVFCDQVPDLVSDRYPLPSERVRVLRHSSYVGVYPDFVSSEISRQRFGYDPHDRVLLFLGGIREYKGLDLLLDAYQKAKEIDDRLRLLVAGRPAKSPGIIGLEARCNSIPGVAANFNMVADSDLQDYFAAADVVVAPYRNILTSGSVPLAMTFARPVVVPRLGCVPDVEALGVGKSFTAGNVEELTAALLSCESTPEVRLRAREIADSYTPHQMSREFRTILSDLLFSQRQGR